MLKSWFGRGKSLNISSKYLQHSFFLPNRPTWKNIPVWMDFIQTQLCPAINLALGPIFHEDAAHKPHVLIAAKTKTNDQIKSS